jgi:hypothetical protein
MPDTQLLMEPPIPPTRTRRTLTATLALLIYLILSLSFFGKAGSWTRWVCGYGSDPLSFVWFIQWWSFALTHHLNPFISYYVWYPIGDNITWHTSVLSASLLTLPITLLGGGALTYNLLTVTAPALAAWTAFLLTRHLTRDWAAAFIGGYLFGFSSYELGQMLGHLNLDLIFLLPLAILLCLRHVRGALNRAYFVPAFAVLLMLQLGLSTEILATSCILGAMTWIVFLACAPATDRPGLRLLAIDIVLAGALMTVLAAPFLFFLIKGLAGVPQEINPISVFSADPLNYLIPTGVTRFGRTQFAPIAALFTGNASEQGAYLGLPLVFLMTFYFRDQMLRPYVRALFIAMLILVAASLGPWLHFAGVQTQLRLPWSLVEKLPLIKSALPTRFTMFISLISAIVTALYLAAPNIGRRRPWRFALAGLACLFLLPNTQAYTWQRWPTQPFFTPQNVHRVLGAKSNVLILPFGGYGPAMAWQLDAGMGFTQSGGYTGFVPPSEWSFAILNDLLLGTTGPDFSNDLTAFCATHGVDHILIGPGTSAPLITAITALGWPQHTDHGVIVVQVPPPATLNYFYAQGDYWPGPAPQNWMGRQLRIVTHGTPIVLTLLGKWRLSAAPVTITLATPSGQVVFPIQRATVQVIPVPANTDLTLTASKTFVPDKYLHNQDERRLSVLISLAKAHP